MKQDTAMGKAIKELKLNIEDLKNSEGELDIGARAGYKHAIGILQNLITSECEHIKQAFTCGVVEGQNRTHNNITDAATYFTSTYNTPPNN